MKLIANLVLILSLIISIGCAFNESRDEIKRRENQTIEEKNRVLRESYNLVTGLYMGTLKLENGDIRNISIGIYTLDVKEGNNSSGEPVFKPILKAIYKQLAPIDTSIVMDGRFLPETGELSFINSGESKSADALNTIGGKINGKTIAGTVMKSSGYLGLINLEFVSKEVNTDPEGADNEYYRILREQYQKIKGTYTGSIIREARDREPRREWNVELGLYIVEVKYGNDPNGEPKFRPVLKARVRQLSPVAPNVIMDVQYIPESNRVVLLTNGAITTDTLHTINAELKYSSDGNLQKTLIVGTASKPSGLWGKINLKFTSPDADAPAFGDQEDYNDRLLKEYQTLIGLYRGTISPVGFKSFDIELKIFVIQEAGDAGLTPKLKAYYRRVEDKDHAVDLTMNVEYKTELSPPGLDMSGQRSNGSLVYFVVLNGVYKGRNGIVGTYHDQRGQEGPFKLTKK